MTKYQQATVSEFSSLKTSPNGYLVRAKTGDVLYEQLVAGILPKCAPKPLTSDAIETLAVIAFMQPIAAKTVAIVRHVDTATTAIKEMADRGLIACGYINRVRHWHVTQALLDQFDLVSTEELRDETVFQETFPVIPDQNMAF